MSEKIYIVDDDPSVRDSLSMLLRSEDYVAVQFSQPTDFIRDIGTTSEGLVILDLCMPVMSGIEVMEEIRKRGNHLPIICITGHGDIPTAVKALKMGASDFLEKPYDSEKLIEIIKYCFEEQKTKKQQQNDRMNARELVDQLTPKEYEVLKGLVDGKMNKQIAYDMGISIRTAELHRAHVLEKLKAKSLSDVIKIALASEV